MSTILGIFHKQGQAINPQWGDDMMQACQRWPSDRQNHFKNSNCFLACRQQFNTPQSPLAQQPYSLDKHKLQLLYDGRLDNRAALAQQLNLPLNAKTTDEFLILNAYLKYQDTIANHLLGDFAMAIYDSAKQQLFLTRDHMGIRPLFIANTDDHIAFASNQKALLCLPWVNHHLNEQWIADTLCITKVDAHTTPYLGIESLPPAHSLHIQTGQFKQSQYWQLNPHTVLADKSDEEYITEFQALLFEAIPCRLRNYGETASELSGGLDSTSVTSIAATLLQPSQKKLYAYS